MKSTIGSMIEEHIIEAIGKSRIVIRDGRIVEVGEPIIKSCPLARRFAQPVEEITPESVRRNIEHRINSFGMCTPDRQITDEDRFIGFGATEMLGAALSVGIIEAVIVAGDGVGTVVVSDPAMLQGIGGRMSGLVSTSPIQEIIDRILDEGGIVTDPENAMLDPVKGIEIAHQAGFKSLAVTVAGADAAERVRQADPGAIIVVVHTTGISKEEAERLNPVADIITGCASLMVREVCGPRALMQAGSSIPVFAMTPIGKEIIIERMRQITHQLIVSHAKLPVRGEDEPTPLQ